MKYRLSNTLFLFLFCNTCFPQTLFYNCNIFTADSTQSQYNYFIVKDGKFLDVGYSENFPDSFSNKIDLVGKSVLPGFVDSHIHFIDGALGLIQTNLEDVANSEILKDRLNNEKRNLLEGIYIARNLGFESVKNIENPLEYLDSIFSDIPAIIFMKSGHAAIANSAGMRKLNFDNNTQIQNAEIKTDARGKLNGWLLEAAAMEALKQIGRLYSQNTLINAIQAGQNKLLSYGITTIGDNTFNPYNYKIYQSLQNAGLLKFRIWSRSYGRIPQTTGLMRSLGIKKLGFIGPKIDFTKIHFHAVKYFEDMSLSVPEASSKVSEPGGENFISTGELTDLFLLNPQSTFAFHVQGKKGLQNILNAIEFTKDRIPLHRNVIDHAGYADIDQLNEIKKLNQSTTIIASQVFDYQQIVKEYSHSKIQFIENDLMNNRLKYIIDKAALTSDYPYGMDTTFLEYENIDGLNPFPNIAVIVSGKYADGKIINGFENKTLTTSDAIKSYTANGAYVLGLEDKIGKIKTGYYADFIVVDKDILNSEPMELYNSKVEQTFINGEKVFDLNKNVENKISQSSISNISSKDYVVSPIFGYDPIQSFIFGGAGFVFPLQIPNDYYDLQIMYSMNNKWNAAVNYKRYELTSNMDLSISAGFSNFNQYYFGESDTTKANNYKNIYADNYFARINFVNKITNNFKLNLFTEFKGRRENYYKDQNNKKFDNQLFPKENALGIGFETFFDTRNEQISTKQGFLIKLEIEYVPSFLNNPYKKNIMLTNADFRYFKYYYNSNHVIAVRATAGTILGKSNYLFRYNFGGSNQLRGYYSNRFRSDDFLFGQLEYRWQFIQRFSAVLFTDAGYVNEKLFEKLLSTYGIGFRFALSSNTILRFDYGFGKDQSGFFFSFGEAF